MNESKPASRRSLKSDLVRVDEHKIKKGEYDELPELTEEMLARAKVNKGGRPTRTPTGSGRSAACPWAPVTFTLYR